MTRKEFISRTPLALMAFSFSNMAFTLKNSKVMTVLGPVDASELGFTLVHEHLMADFIGAKLTGPHRYNIDEVVKVVLPYLLELKKYGCKTFVDCTATFLGRDVEVAQKLAVQSGLHIITNTGNYAALGGRFLPDYVQEESAEAIASRWIQEWKEGIAGKNIFPGIIKIGVDEGPLNQSAIKLVRASAITHLATGLSISAHTGNGEAALAQLAILKEYNVSPSAFRWVHAQNEKSLDIHLKVAQSGAYIELDGIRPNNLDEHLQMALNLKKNGFIKKILLSQDAGWYSVGEPGGGVFNKYTLIFEQFIPALEKAGFTKKEIRILFIDNPRESLTPNIKRIE